MEYEFRGWNGKEFIYGGAPVKNPSGGYHYVRDGYGMVIEHSVIAIDQWTGLKDKNGVKIYKGDIVNDGYETALVDFHTEDIGSCGCCYTAFSGSGFAAFSDSSNSSGLGHCCEVIGNIHQNPELL